MPPWGRPPGAKGSKARRRWERDQARYRESVRVEELDSDDSSDARGVAVNGYPARYSAIDVAPKSRKAYAYQPDSSSSSSASSTDSDSSDSSGNVSAAQIALRDKEEALVQSALARIRRAQEKGKLEVKLREDELAALENRRKRIAAENATKAKPKSSPSSSKRDKASGGSERRNKKGSGPPMVTVPIVPPPELASSSSRPHSRRHSRAIHADPALMESYAAEYRPPSSHQHQHHASPGRPRSSSSLARPGSQHYAYPPPPMMTGRHVSDGVRPGSSASMAGMQMPMTVMRALLPHEEGWDPSASRRGSVGSGVEYDPFEYQVRAEGEYGRGGGVGGGGGGAGYPVGGEVVYSNVRRAMPPSGAGVYVERRKESSSSEETDEGSGVKVVPERVREREREVVPVPVATPKKKGRKKKR
ncbi:hypothetical protein VC83_09038 [Pseudogymnoascus destructans]|uniref:Uncharacterized protein n=2 Tax=Pseudogymnoascus destructans TaxID=655981 RepID=L8FVY0_PSED2|nr:uncharacterized protein VC83_09038 [Pseudogymnoascus destructans]ELR03931.1 hypothetical protein GMDG_06459 [Pseudogymnoascus destructans 20631-21]OAF54467.1 hypothetical protein VC83_09038 [Pseudogymnoascus destructans]